MTVLAMAHVSWMVTAPIALILAVAVLWYWVRLGRTDVPISRRRIRRTSLVIILVTIPVLFGASSLIDPTRRQSAYVILWSVGFLCLLMIVVTAVIDALNSMRMHREAAQEQTIKATAQLIRSLNQLEDSNAGFSPDDNDAPQSTSNGAVP